MATRTEMTKDHFKCAIWDENSILDTLVNEAMELKEKIENSRIREDYGTYKNLILAFKEIVNLIHEEKERGKPKTIVVDNLFIKGDMLMDASKIRESLENAMKNSTSRSYK